MVRLLNLTRVPVQENVLFFYLFFLAPSARTTRYEESFLPKGKKSPRSLRCLGLASLLLYQLHYGTDFFNTSPFSCLYASYIV